MNYNLNYDLPIIKPDCTWGEKSPPSPEPEATRTYPPQWDLRYIIKI
jgi:hypothetical protein